MNSTHSFRVALLSLAAMAAITASTRGQCLSPPANFYAWETSDCSPVQIGWDIVEGADGYGVEREPVGDPGHREQLGFFQVWPIQDSTASPGVQYNYYVYAQGACGNSDYAGPVVAGRYLPASPSWVTATDNQFCDLIVVDWDTTNWPHFYEIYRGTTDNFEDSMLLTTQGSPPYEDYNVQGNVGYTYWVASGMECGTRLPVASDIGYSNYGMDITRGPESTYVLVGQPASFSVEIRGFASFEWFRDGELLQDGGTISGANTRTLTISATQGGDTGEYYCVAYGGCGSRQSQSATLIVYAFCPADFNYDAFVDFFDYDEFVGAFESGSNRADFNFDGFIDFFDYDDYVGAFERGC